MAVHLLDVEYNTSFTYSAAAPKYEKRPRYKGDRLHSA